MIYALEGHDLKHAVEEMLFHLLPTANLTRADTVGEDCDWCRSLLSEQGGEAVGARRRSRRDA